MDEILLNIIQCGASPLNPLQVKEKEMKKEHGICDYFESQEADTVFQSLTVQMHSGKCRI